MFVEITFAGAVPSRGWSTSILPWLGTSPSLPVAIVDESISPLLFERARTTTAPVCQQSYVAGKVSKLKTHTPLCLCLVGCDKLMRLATRNPHLAALEFVQSPWKMYRPPLFFLRVESTVITMYTTLRLLTVGLIPATTGFCLFGFRLRPAPATPKEASHQTMLLLP